MNGKQSGSDSIHAKVQLYSNAMMTPSGSVRETIPLEEMRNAIRSTDVLLRERLREEHPPLRLDIVTTEEAFFMMSDEWNSLADNSSATIFQTFEWQSSWWKHFGAGNDRRLHILLLRADSRLVGIAPFFVQQYFLGRRLLLQHLRLMGCGLSRNRGAYELFGDYSPSDFLDIIAARGYEAEVAACVASHLNKSASSFAEIDLRSLPEEGILYNQVLPKLNAREFAPFTGRSELCPQLMVPEFSHQAKQGTQRKVRQAKKAFSEGPLAAIETVQCHNNLDGALSTLMHLHQRRWNSLGYPGVYSDMRFQLFQREVAGRFMENGWLWFKIAVFNGTPIAARFTLQYHGRMYDYLSGFDHTAIGARRRPGLALLASMMDDAQQAGIRVIELLRGDEKYKFELTAGGTRVWDIKVRRRQRPFPMRLALALQAWDGFRRIVHREFFLLCIQIKQRGPVMFLFSYWRFSTRRLSAKVSRVGGKLRPSGRTHAE